MEMWCSFTEAIATEGACISKTGMWGLRTAGRLARQRFASQLRQTRIMVYEHT